MMSGLRWTIISLQ